MRQFTREELDLVEASFAEEAIRDDLRAWERRQWKIEKIEQLMERDINAYYEYGFDKKLLKLMEQHG